MSKTFMAYYSTGEWGKMWFTAENQEHAEELLDKVENGELLPQELPDFNYSVKGEDGWAFEGLEEIGDKN